MKRSRTVCLIMLLLLLFVGGCGAGTYNMTISNKKATIKINNVPDGKYAEAEHVTVRNGQKIKVTSTLDKGELQIEFAPVTIFTYPDSPDDVIIGNPIATVTVGPNATEELELSPDDYAFLLTAIGETNGTVVITVE